MVYGQFYHKAGDNQEMININVGGLKQKIEQTALLKFPETRLGKLLECVSEDKLELCDDYDEDNDEYYFDRNPSLFHYVLNFYNTGKLHVMEEMCVFSFSQEIEYWGISELRIHHCCIYKYHERKENLVEKEFDIQSDDVSILSLEDFDSIPQQIENFKHKWQGEYRKRLWLVLENPDYSILSKVYTVSSLTMVIISIISMWVHSLPEFQKEPEDPTFVVFEVFCIVWFTTEYAARLIAAPCIRKFLRSSLNIIDFLSFLPFFITLAIERIGEGISGLENIGRVVQVLRLMRIFRILKLARHSNGLQSLGATFTHSFEEVWLLFVFLTVGIAIFSALIYSTEKEEEEAGINSIPVGWWWATITLTTVGYGDTCPVTIPGKIVASVCIIFGLLMVALPVTVIFNKFTKYYKREDYVDPVIRNQEIRNLVAGAPCVNIRDIYVKKMRSILFVNWSLSNHVSMELSLGPSKILDHWPQRNSLVIN
uniref:BTB domain-containing protein n=1 Tax=Callorhinchus milii TaxID=7868 RepID=A0A4W3K5J4_CALMI